MALGAILKGIGRGVGKAAQAAGSVLGGAAAGQAGAKQTKEQAQLERDRLALQRWQAAQRLPGERLNLTTRASVLRNQQPVSIGWGGPGSGLRGERTKISGGYANPNLIDVRARQLADDVIAQQLAAQLSRQGPPEISGAGKSSVWEKLLGGAALGANLLGGVQTAFGEDSEDRFAGQPPRQYPISRNVRPISFG